MMGEHCLVRSRFFVCVCHLKKFIYDDETTYSRATFFFNLKKSYPYFYDEQTPQNKCSFYQIKGKIANVLGGKSEQLFFKFTSKNDGNLLFHLIKRTFILRCSFIVKKG